MSPQQINNLIAFTKLYGYVRFFHPSDEAQQIDWEKFAIYGVKKVENTKNSDEFLTELNDLFLPIAPTLKIYKSGQVLDITPFIPLDTSGLKEICWKHYGIWSLKQSKHDNIYTSVRGINKKDSSSDLFKPIEKFPQANEFFKSDIGAGLSISMPLALYKDSSGTLPHSDTSKLSNLLKRIETEVPGELSGKDKSVRLAGIIICWNILKHFYPYFDVIKTDWNSELQPALKEADANTSEFDFLITLRKLCAKLEDGHGMIKHSSDIYNFYFPPFYWDWIEDKLVITKVYDEAKDKLKLGDVIIEVNGKPALDELLDKEQYVSGATVQWKRSSYKRIGAQNTLMGMLSGDKESILELKIRRGNEKEFTAKFKRTMMNVNNEPIQPKIEEKLPGIFYLDLSRINDEDFNNALDMLVKAKGVILDMRGYPKSLTPVFLQHIINKNVTSARWMIPLNVYPDQMHTVFNENGRWDLEPLLPHINAKIAFITDGKAISYAESIMGIVEYYKLGEIIGEPTAGTNGNINQFTLPGGYEITFTGMKVLKHDGSKHHGVGIQPTIVVHKTIKGIIEGKDEQLEKAIEVVSK